MTGVSIPDGVTSIGEGAFSSVSLNPAGVRLTIRATRGTLGQNIGVEYSPDLSPGPWIELVNFSPVDGAWVFTDPDSVRRARPAGFYRAFLRPQGA